MKHLFVCDEQVLGHQPKRMDVLAAWATGQLTLEQARLISSFGARVDDPRVLAVLKAAIPPAQCNDFEEHA